MAKILPVTPLVNAGQSLTAGLASGLIYRQGKLSSNAKLVEITRSPVGLIGLEG